VELLPQDGTVDDLSETLVVRVTERPLDSLSMGAGANSELGAHIFGEATDRSLFLDGRSTSLRLDGYFDPQTSEISQGIATLRYSDPYFLDSNYNYTEDLRFQRLETSAQEFDLERISLATYFYRTWRGEALSFGHTLAQENLSEVSPDAVLSELDQGTVDLSFLSSRIDIDRRDSPLNPRSGYNLNFEYKVALESLASDADFHTLLGKASYLLQPSWWDPRWSIATLARGGASWTFGDTPEIPISQRFYLGGRGSVRGFRENSLGPRGTAGSVIGGDTTVSGSGELRYSFSDFAEAHLFLDMGNVFLRDRSFSLDDLRYATGVGVRYLSPLGPIGFDVAHPIDEQPGEPSVRVHFVIGSNF
jgi:outer membrane protein assembly factor BamA